MLARYRILHELGRGATGAVYAARDRETGGVVALKRLDPALLGKSDAEFARRFLKHARSARRLDHRNIVKVHDAGEAGGTVYVAMEMLEGQSLRNILDGGPLPIARAMQIAHDVACGLAYAHLEGAVHGCVKPSNVIVLRSGVVKITDFGIGQLEQAALLSGARAGGLSYMSPEQARGEPVDHRCDIFALGALFYEMLTHRPPFKGDSPKEIMENILHAEPPLPSELNPHVPRALDGIVLSMLAAQPAGRMPGAPILLRDLQRLEEGLGLRSDASAESDEPMGSVPPAEPEPRLPMPDSSHPRDRAPMRDASRFARQGEDRGDASGSLLRDLQRLEKGLGLRSDASAGTDEPAPSVPPAEPEPKLRAPGRSRTRDRASMRDAARFARPGEDRGDASGYRIRADSSAGEAFQDSSRMTEAEAFDYHKAMVMMERESRRERSSGSRRAIFAALALVLVALGMGLTGFMYYSSGSSERGIASRMREALATVAEATKKPQTAPVATQAPSAPAVGDRRAEQESSGISPVPSRMQEALATAPSAPQASPPAVSDGQAEQESSPILSVPDPVPPKPLAREPSPVAQNEALVAPAPEHAAAGATPAQELTPAKEPAAKVAERQPAGTARLIVAVSPRGEIYIDSKHHGTTPPITTFDLEPGMHRIEIRSGSRKPYLTYMTVQAGDVRRIRHDFSPSRAVHPPKSRSWQSTDRR